MSALDDFITLFKKFGTVGALAAAGSVVAPIVGAASGLAPPWPKNLDFVTATLSFLTVAMIFQFLPRTRKGYARVFITGTLAFVVSLLSQVYLHMRFVTTAPGIEGPLLLGCEWKRDILLLASRPDAHEALDTRHQCPGDYRYLLEISGNDPSAIWTAASIDNVAMMLALTWVLLFVFFAVSVGSFVVFNAGRKGKAKPAAPVTGQSGE